MELVLARYGTTVPCFKNPRCFSPSTLMTHMFGLLFNHRNSSIKILLAWLENALSTITYPRFGMLHTKMKLFTYCHKHTWRVDTKNLVVNKGG